MADMWEIYVNDLHKNFGKLYANWPPSRPIELGDFGRLEDGHFERKGNIKGDFDVAFSVRAGDGQTSHYSYKSAKSTEVTFHAAGGADPATGVAIKAALDIKFSSENAVFFNAAGCRVDGMESPHAVGKAILQLYEADKWDDDWVVVTNLIAAKATTVVISGGSQSEIKLEAEGNVPVIKLADASLKLGVKSERNIGLQIVTDAGMIPLLAFYRVRAIWFGDDSFEPKSLVGPAPGSSGFRLKRRLKQENKPIEEGFVFVPLD